MENIAVLMVNFELQLTFCSFLVLNCCISVKMVKLILEFSVIERFIASLHTQQSTPSPPKKSPPYPTGGTPLSMFTIKYHQTNHFIKVAKLSIFSSDKANWLSFIWATFLIVSFSRKFSFEKSNS